MLCPPCFSQDLGDAAAPSDLKVNLGEQMLKALLRGWAEQRRRRGQLRQQQQQQQQGGAAAEGSAVANSSDDGGGEGGGGGGDVDMSDAEGDAGKASGGSSRFRFQGALPPVDLVSGGGPSAALPWRCAIDSFTGDEDLPQVGR